MAEGADFQRAARRLLALGGTSQVQPEAIEVEAGRLLASLADDARLRGGISTSQQGLHR